MKLTVVLAALIGTFVIACSNTAPVPAEPTPDIDATVEAKVAQERAVDATVQAKVSGTLSASEAKTPSTTQAACKLTGGETVQSGWTGEDTGNNSCNSCFCTDGVLGCTKMACPAHLALSRDCSLDNQYCNSEGGDETSTRLIGLGWNKPTSVQTTYLRTSDLSDDSVRVVEDGIRAGEDYLGSYGPLRVYVIGTDVEAAHIVAMDFCSWAYGGVNGDNYEYCLESDQGVEIREIAEYAGSNAFAQHSRELETPNQSFVIGNPLQFESGLGSRIAIHEYVHIYQNANKVDENDFGLPLWLEEGSAEFLALYLSQEEGWADFRMAMAEALESAKNLQERHPGIGIQDIETSESRDALQSICDCTGMLQYETGQWATAWLVNRTSLDIFYKSYIPDIVDLGGHGSFEKHFGLTVQEFYGEFDEFMSSSTGNQLAILPIP